MYNIGIITWDLVLARFPHGIVKRLSVNREQSKRIAQRFNALGALEIVEMGANGCWFDSLNGDFISRDRPII